MKIYWLILLTVFPLQSCFKGDVDEKFKDNNSSSSSSESNIKMVEEFIRAYNDSLKIKVNKSSWDSFYLYDKKRFKINIIFSEKNTLIYVERIDTNINVYNILNSYKDPQLTILEIKNNWKLFLDPNIQYPILLGFEKNGFNTIYGINFEGTPTPYQLNNNSFVLSYGISIKLNYTDTSILTLLRGVSFYIGSTDIKVFEKQFREAYNNLLNFEIQQTYLKSELFRKALVHPILKNIAIKIKERQAEAENKVREYPYYEFESHLDEMRKIAKENGLKDNYVNEMIKDAQYDPISGTLLFYYSNELGFMVQWIVVNTFIFILVVVLKLTRLKNNGWVLGSIFSIIILVNGYIFNKKPDLINVMYWIIPGLLMIFTLAILNYAKIFKVFKSLSSK